MGINGTFPKSGRPSPVRRDTNIPALPKKDERRPSYTFTPLLNPPDKRKLPPSEAFSRSLGLSARKNEEAGLFHLYLLA
ncbi:MAG TPA: hypothetical protein H9874_06665, partial [Candidatus Bilophila faecipullorum]|nr:hypothetical protein [Candidatus Bilophila faecipullorum]